MSNITIDELKKYKGNICLYSTNFEENLGDLIKKEFKDLFGGNSFTYNISLGTKTDCPLILIDGDDFNPSKVAGLVKSYEIPIVIFIGNSSKLDKLKTVLLTEPLIIDKNTCNAIVVTENVKQNIEEKRIRDEQKKIAEEVVPVAIMEETAKETVEILPVVEKKKESSSKSFFFSDDIENVQNMAEEQIIEEPKKTEAKAVETSKMFFEKDSLQKEEEILDEIPLFEKKLVKKYDFSEEIRQLEQEKKEKLKKETEGYFFYKDKKLENIGCYTNDLSIIEVMNSIFKKVNSITFLDDKTKFDIVIVDITFALSQRVLDFLKKQNCPSIIISKRSSKLEEFKEINCLDVLYIEKPIMVSKDIIIDNFKEYLNHFDNSKLKFKINRPEVEFEEPINDNEENINFDNIPKTTKAYRKPSVEAVKEEINKTNKRSDKKISLSEIYEKMGLNDIAIFNSKINTAIFMSNDNVLVKYTPAGYFIEYRIKRLESQGLPKEQINSMMKEFEDADIRFQKKILNEIDNRPRAATY